MIKYLYTHTIGGQGHVVRIFFVLVGAPEEIFLGYHLSHRSILRANLEPSFLSAANETALPDPWPCDEVWSVGLPLSHSRRDLHQTGQLVGVQGYASQTRLNS